MAALGHLACWDERVVTVLRRAGVGGTLDRAVDHGVLFTSSYSGWDAPREAWRLLQRVLRAGSCWCSSCDVGPLQRQALERIGAELSDRRACVHVDVMSFLAPEAQRYVEGLIPDTSASAAQKVEAHTAIMEFLRKNARWAYDPDSRCWCAVHGQACPQWPLEVWLERAGKEVEAGASAKSTIRSGGAFLPPLEV